MPCGGTERRVPVLCPTHGPSPSRRRPTANRSPSRSLFTSSPPARRLLERRRESASRITLPTLNGCTRWCVLDAKPAHDLSTSSRTAARNLCVAPARPRHWTASRLRRLCRASATNGSPRCWPSTRPCVQSKESGSNGGDIALNKIDNAIFFVYEARTHSRTNTRQSHAPRSNSRQRDGGQTETPQCAHAEGERRQRPARGADCG